MHYWNSGNTGDVVCLHSKATARNMQPWGAGCAWIWTIKIYKFVENNTKMSYESEKKTILFLSLLHVLKFKISHRIITYTLRTWYVSNLAIFWLCDWDFGACVRVFWITSRVGVSVFPHTSWVHAKWGGQNSQTVRVYAHTYNMTPSVSSVSSYPTVLTNTIWILVLFSFAEVDMICFK